MQPHPDLETEQAHLDLAYTRLDALRALARTRLETAMRQGNEGTHQNRSERDSFTSLYTDRLAALDAVESRLLFGRTDTDDGSTWIGRIGLTTEAQQVLQIDWRAPAAAPFYQATAARPLGVRRRRHITTEGRAVTALSDEVLDPDLAATDGSDSQRLGAAGRARRRAHRPHGRHRRHHPVRAGPHHPLERRRARSSCRAARAPARRPWPCTGRRTCSTRTATGSSAPACSCSGRRRCSCATSRPCCPRSARPAWC